MRDESKEEPGSEIDVSLLGDGECGIVHRGSGAAITSSVPLELGGHGGAFSSTDLLAAALGSCIASSLEPVAVRHGVPLDSIRMTVAKTLGVRPKRIDALRVTIRIDASVSAEVRTRLVRAAEHCLVRRSLAADLPVTIDFPGDGG